MSSSQAAGNGGDQQPSTSSPASSSGQQWLQTLSDPELDLLISLKDLVTAQLASAGHASRSHHYDLRTLRVVGIALLENIKQRLEETSVDPNVFDRLALLSDPDVHFPCSGSDSESELVGSKHRPSEQMGVNGQPKQMEPGWRREQGEKKRKLDESR